MVINGNVLRFFVPLLHKHQNIKHYVIAGLKIIYYQAQCSFKINKSYQEPFGCGHQKIHGGQVGDIYYSNYGNPPDKSLICYCCKYTGKGYKKGNKANPVT